MPAATAILGAIAVGAAVLAAAAAWHFTKIMQEMRANPVDALDLGGASLRWHRLDDGVMGGKSKSHVHVASKGLQFAGTINTNGGGFASVRAEAAERAVLLPADARSLRVSLKGDGLQYKLLLSKGGGGPFNAAPSWQVDIPTRRGGGWEQRTFALKDFFPSFGGSKMREPDKYTLVPEEMREVGFMLSLMDAHGEPNPAFGEGVFEFSLDVRSIEVVR